MNIDWRYQLWKAGVTITDNVSGALILKIRLIEINNKKLLKNNFLF